MRILVVEDDRQMADIIIEAVSLWGHRPKWANTGAQALSLLRRASFDLVLLDIYLPDMTGIELLTELPSMIDIRPPIVAMTGFNSPEIELQIRQQGVIFYLIKPFDLPHLRSIVEHIADRTTSR